MWEDVPRRQEITIVVVNRQESERNWALKNMYFVRYIALPSGPLESRDWGVKMVLYNLLTNEINIVSSILGDYVLYVNCSFRAVRCWRHLRRVMNDILVCPSTWRLLYSTWRGGIRGRAPEITTLSRVGENQRGIELSKTYMKTYTKYHSLSTALPSRPHWVTWESGLERSSAI